MLALFIIILQITILAYAVALSVHLAFCDFILPLGRAEQNRTRGRPDPYPAGPEPRRDLSLEENTACPPSSFS
jgi:hypothetical protein